jgi:hypothetical protein
MLTEIVRKFNLTIHLLESIKSEKPLYQQIDVRTMLDMLLDNIKTLIYYSEQPINIDKLESDLQAIECLEEQHKRVLMTYLMQDWKNLKEVLTLIKLGEIYKSIAEKLVDVPLLINSAEKQ